MFGLGVLSTWTIIAFICALSDSIHKGGITLGSGILANIVTAPAILLCSAAILFVSSIKFSCKAIDKHFNIWYNNFIEKKRRMNYEG